MNKKTIRDIEVAGKKVLVRCDFNVPLDSETGKITDNRRIRAALPTINYLLDNNAKVILCSHLGRPKGEVTPKYSLKPVAEELSKIPGITLLNKTFFNEFTLKLDRSASALVEKMAGHKLLGGVPVSRFYPDKDDLLLVARTEMNNTEESLFLREELKK